MELHHPIMSKLWDPGDRAQRKKDIVVDTVISHWVTEVDLTEKGAVGLGYSIQ